MAWVRAFMVANCFRLRVRTRLENRVASRVALTRREEDGVWEIEGFCHDALSEVWEALDAKSKGLP